MNYMKLSLKFNRFRNLHLKSSCFKSLIKKSSNNVSNYMIDPFALTLNNVPHCFFSLPVYFNQIKLTIILQIGYARFNAICRIHHF